MNTLDQEETIIKRSQIIKSNQVDESSTECRSYNLHVQRIFSTVMSRPESILIRQD